jgi:hypothetical protein
MLADCELAARHLDFYHKPVKTTVSALSQGHSALEWRDAAYYVH